VEFLTALSLVGDPSCIEAIAAAHARAKDAWWREQLARVFREVVARERLTRRHRAVRKAEKKWKSAIDAMWLSSS
jgi:hypothetical protein